MAVESLMAVTVGQKIIASTTGSLLTSLFMTPFDVVKTRLQVQQKPIVRGHCFLYSNGLMDHVCACTNGHPDLWYKRGPPAPTKQFSGMFDAFVKIAKFEGPASLWSGLSPTLVMAVPATTIYFTLYDNLKYQCGYSESDPSTAYRASLAGGFARSCTVLTISPLELIRTKLQSEKLSYTQIWSAISRTIHHAGYLSLWRGLSPTLLRDIPFSMTYWFGYERLKCLSAPFFPRGSAVDPDFAQAFFCGALSGSFAAIITLPFDVIKTHRQIELGQMDLLLTNNSTATNQKKAVIHPCNNPLHHHHHSSSPSLRSSSTWLLMVNLWKHQGFKSMFAGIGPRVAKIAPACAIMISTFEYSKHLFRIHNSRHKEAMQSSSDR